MRIKAIIGSVLAVVSTGVEAADALPSFPDLINRVNTVAQNNDQEAAISVLDEIQQLPRWGWGFGGGPAPADRSYVTEVALRAYEPVLGWKARAEGMQSAGSELIKWLRSNARSSEEMMTLLSSNEPVARLIALEKIGLVNVVAPALLPRLRVIASEDDRLMILLRHPNGLAPGAAGIRRDDPVWAFDAPLRRLAIQRLKSAGELPHEIDERQLGREGLAWLARIYLSKLDDAKARDGIQRSLLYCFPSRRRLRRRSVASL